MKTEKWYDVRCLFCGRYLSTDFGKGMQRSAATANYFAKEVGFKTMSGENICPLCSDKKKAHGGTQ